MVFDDAARVVGMAQRELAQHYPRPGWVEHDAEEIWASQVGVTAGALARAGLGPRDIAAVGITNQRETVVVWDRATGRPVHRAIVWQDRRTAEVCARLREQGHEPAVAATTGLLLDPYFSATKAAWILDHVPGARTRAERGELALGTIDSWLLFKLTGGAVHATDVSNASRTMLFDIERGRWDEGLCGLFGVPMAMLPEVRGSSEVLGHVARDLPAAGVPIAGMAGDQQAAMMGQLCTEPGLAKNTYGTGCFLLMNTGKTRRVSGHRLLSTVAWKLDGRTSFALEGGVFVGGAIVQWLRDGLGLIDRSADITSLALREPDSGGVVLVPALAGLGAPHWDPQARGLLIGLTRGTTAGHIARAALEGIAFQVADLVGAMQADAAGSIRELRVDGGASVNDVLMQFQADVLQLPVVRPKNPESTALGAAFLAGLAVGVWPSTAALAGLWEMDRRFEPAMSAAEARGRLAVWRDAVGRSRGWDGE